MSIVIKAPSPIEIDNHFVSVFLAGTIGVDSQKTENWQQYVSEKLSDYAVTIYNPRRDKWEGSWEQNIKNIDLKIQINWEIDGLNISDFIIMNILGDSTSPISLLEFGMFAKSDKLIVCCPKEFYRYGNIQVICYKYDIPLYDDIDELLNSFIKDYL